MCGLFPCNIAILFTTFSAKKIFPAMVVFIQTLFRIKSGKFWRTFPPLYILQQKSFLISFCKNKLQVLTFFYTPQMVLFCCQIFLYHNDIF